MTESKSEAMSNEAAEDLRLLYQVTCQDLAQFKQQQWQVSNYGLLLYGAIVGIAQLIRPISDKEAIILLFLIVIIIVSCVFCILKLEKSIKARRDRLKNVRGKLSKELESAWATQNKEPDSPAISNLLIAALSVGAGVVLWLVLCEFSI
ncbi:hypothetical protein [Azotobacter chroococcum]|uniref:Uncharacterized protein n=1 Tax=Azotobacter chroococcum TaxID=353 RepID=A0AAP9YAR8_9GAMM|nr:hypothetical protein [Azotobacter chroococcum]QQE87917.1 hypothetical protein GKQ51_16870 [Azotobacter chroococcum]